MSTIKIKFIRIITSCFFIICVITFIASAYFPWITVTYRYLLSYFSSSAEYTYNGEFYGSELVEVNKNFCLTIFGYVYIVMFYISYSLSFGIFLFYKLSHSKRYYIKFLTILIIISAFTILDLTLYPLIIKIEIENFKSRFSVEDIFNSKIPIFTIIYNEGYFYALFTFFLILLIILLLFLEYSIFKGEETKIKIKEMEIESYNGLVLLKKLLLSKECEFLDFKYDMYDIFAKDIKRKLETRKEFLKDVLALINNKSKDMNDGNSYIIIGVGDEKEKYNGKHKNIDFTNYQTLLQLIDKHITPKFDKEFEEYYISGDNENIILKNVKDEGYDRIILIHLKYVIGTIYEIRESIGNPQIGVPYYEKGTAFYREGSHTFNLTQEIRNKITDISAKKIIIETKNLEIIDRNIRIQAIYNIIKDLLERANSSSCYGRGDYVHWQIDWNIPTIRYLSEKRQILINYGEDLKYLSMKKDDPLNLYGGRYIINEKEILIDSAFLGSRKFEEYKSMILQDLKKYCKDNFNIDLN